MYGSGGAGWAGTGDIGSASSGGGTPGTAACDAPVNRGGGGADCSGVDTKGGSGASGLVVVRYTYNNPPTIGAFSSAATASYSSNENVAGLYSLGATDTDAGSTLTYSLTGTDAGDFALSASGTLSFSPAPDFEAPTDSDTNNTYVVITWVSDGLLSDSQTVTITVLNVNEAGTITGITLGGSPSKGIAVQTSVTVNTAGKVRFFLNGKRIAGCLAVSTAGSYPTLTATCNWKPTVTGRHSLTAQFTPTNSSFSSVSAAPLSIWVLKRTTTR
jgi:VCBS repeat-containing protein